MSRIFLGNEQLIEKLEQRAGVTFTKTVKDLYYKFGYLKMKLLLVYMKQNNLVINNTSIRTLFKVEKHLRHTMMPKVEAFEVILKNHMLHEITRIIGDKNVFSEPGDPAIFIKGTEGDLKSALNFSLRKAFKNNSYDISNNEFSIFDWIHPLMLGNLLKLFNSLRPKIKETILKKAFKVKIDLVKVTNELEKVRLLRNKLAHAEQIFAPRAMKIDIFKSGHVNNYPLALKDNINKSFFKKVFNEVIPYIDYYLDFFNKYKKQTC